jgi:AcrR family transcriptional regulator
MVGMTPAAIAAQSRQTADERRETVLRAAAAEFAELGYQAASTAAIAKRAGISQPYIYALFPNKQELFFAVYDRTLGRIRSTFAEAVRGAAGAEDALHRMGATYPALIEDRHTLLCQLQAHAASGDAAVREHVARGFQALVDDVARSSGASPRQLAEFFAVGMLANVTTILGLPEVCESLWDESPA